MEIISLRQLNHYLHSLIEKKLWLKVILAMVLGCSLGFLIGPSFGLVSTETTQIAGSWLGLPGSLFLKLVQMIMIPLIFSSIIIGLVASENKGNLKVLGLRVLFYFIFTTVISIIIGIAVSFSFNPGKYFGGSVDKNGIMPQEAVRNTEIDFNTIPNYISDLIPDNPLASMVTGEMLSIVIFTIIIGVALLSLAPKTIEPIVKLISSVQEVCMIVVKWAMKLVPVAVFGLMAQLCSSIGVDSLLGISMYIITVIVGLLILSCVYLLIISLVVKTNPLTFLKKIREVQLLTFSTTSSAAVMPLSLKTAEEKLGVDKSISSFIIPIGTTINMDGTAVYQCVSTIFIAQVYGIELGTLSLLLIIVTIIAASIGTPSIPGGGVIILGSVMQSVGIPTEGIVLIIGVERILGMFRTAVNVTGDLTACVLFNKISTTKTK